MSTKAPHCPTCGCSLVPHCGNMACYWLRCENCHTYGQVGGYWTRFLLLHAMGIEPRTPSTAYNFWSGFGSDIGEFAIFGLVWRRLNCHTKGCWKLGLHHVPGTGFITCRKHHPTVPDAGATAEHIAAAHAEANP